MTILELSQLQENLAYLPPADLSLVESAYQFAGHQHEGFYTAVEDLFCSSFPPLQTTSQPGQTTQP